MFTDEVASVQFVDVREHLIVLGSGFTVPAGRNFPPREHARPMKRVAELTGIAGYGLWRSGGFDIVTVGTPNGCYEVHPFVPKF